MTALGTQNPHTDVNAHAAWRQWSGHGGMARCQETPPPPAHAASCITEPRRQGGGARLVELTASCLPSLPSVADTGLWVGTV